MAFPSAGTVEAFDAIRRDEAALRPGVEIVCRTHDLRGEIRRFEAGSLPVYAIGEHVLKLFPPCYPGECDTEESALRAVHGRLPIPTPRVHARGDEAGWSWVLMDHLRGASLVTAWPHIPREEQLALADTLGETVAALHTLSTSGVSAPRPVWSDFVAERAAASAAQQRKRGLEERFAAQVDAFLAGAVPQLRHAPALLHTEIMREHLLVEETARGWRLSGLFDFEPAMIGDAEYELASVGVFVSSGDGPFLRRLLLARGYRERDLDRALQLRCLTHALLHKYSNLRWYLERVPAPNARTLEDLAERWWALS